MTNTIRANARPSLARRLSVAVLVATLLTGGGAATFSGGVASANDPRCCH